MAEVVLTRADGTLPPVCVGCGRPAIGTRRVRVLGPSSGVAEMVGEHALANLERMARGPGRIRLPVCWWHRWIVPPSISATAGRDGTTHLTGLSAEFAKAMG
jgi:hypothetical protein